MKYLVFFRNIWSDSLVVEPSAQLCFLPQSRAFYDQNFTSVESLWPQHIITSGLLFTALFFYSLCCDAFSVLCAEDREQMHHCQNCGGNFYTKVSTHCVMNCILPRTAFFYESPPQQFGFLLVLRCPAATAEQC